MDIENIVEEIIMDEVGMTDTGYSRDINYIQIKDIASQISSDIKKELKLIGSGKVTMDLPQLDIWFMNGKQINSFFKKYHNKSINIYIEEI